MTIEELMALIQLDGSSLNLDLSTLNSSAINQQVAPFFKDGILALANAQRTETDTQIQVQGTGAALPFTGMTVTAVFTLDANNVAAAEITATGSDTWKFSSSFPILEFTLFDKLFYNPSPQLLLTSNEQTFESSPVPMTFNAQLSDNSIFALLNLIFGEQSHQLTGAVSLSPDMSDQIETLTPAPRITVYGPEGATFDLGLFQIGELRYEIYGDPYVNYHLVMPEVDVHMRFTGVMIFQAQNNDHEIVFGAELKSPTEDVLFYADFTDVSELALSEVQSLVNGINLSIPLDGISIANLIVLKEVKLLVNPSGNPLIRYITFHLQTLEYWTIIENLIELQEIDVLFRVDNPVGGGASVSGVVMGLLAIGETGTLEMSVAFGMAQPATIGGALREGDALNIQEVFQHFANTQYAHFPNISVVDFDFSMTLPSQNSPAVYSGVLELEGEWEILSASPQIVLQDIKVTLDHPDAETTNFTAHATLLFQGIGIVISAEYHGEEKGWEFAGLTESDTPIPIGDLMESLAEFGGLTLPAALQGAEIDALGVTFNTGEKRFTFHAEIMFPIDDTHQVSMRVDIDTFEKKFYGQIRADVNDHQYYFDVKFVGGAQSKTFVASYSHREGDPVPTIKDLVGALSPTVAEYIPDGISVDIRDIVFAFQKDDTTSNYLFAIDIDALIDLSHLPLIGEKLPKDQQVGVQPLQLVVAKEQFSEAVIQNINGLLPTTVNPLPDGILAKGFNVAATLQLGGLNQPLVLPSNNTTAPPVAQPTTPNQAQTDDGTLWYKVQRTFGPIHFERIGLSYKNKQLWFLLDASLTVAGLSIGMNGLGVGSSLEHFDPQFTLHGLAIDYSQPGFEIGGAFLANTINYQGKDYPAYSGKAVIKTSTLMLEAIGSYMQLDEGPSLFIYAILDYPIGGPAFFFVRGLAAGFGFNRRLNPPNISQVDKFPLVMEASGESPKPDSLATELTRLQAYIPPSVGDYWLAAGIRFSTFELIDSFILLMVQFGNRLEVDVYGLSTMVLPAPDATDAGVTPIAELQLALRAAWIPDSGLFSIEAQLTSNSFLLSRNCHLTGGFAFYTWYAGDHAGDFVLSVGGYHPSFSKPDHYPSVPRLGFNWNIDSHLSLKGSAYYSLTPSMLMAGASLNATWVDGSLKAWFDASLNILFSWKPYHYSVDFHISIGASYTFHFFGTHHITAHLGADLNIWGPEFSGRAHISWTIISFTISFGGHAKTTPDPLDWTRFKTAFLPDEDKVCTVAVKEGIIHQADSSLGSGTDLGVVNPKTLRIITDSVIPASHGYASDTTANTLPASSVTVGFAPMNQQNVMVNHRIIVKRNGDDATSEFVYDPITKNLPAALWGSRFSPSLHGNATVQDMLSGYELRPKPAAESSNNPSVARSDLQDAQLDAEQNAFVWLDPSVLRVTDQNDGERRQGIQSTISQVDVTNARDSIVNEFLSDYEIDLSNFNANEFFVAPQIMEQ